MKKAMELLAPGGDTDAIKAAIVAGADAVYCGLDRFNARNRATNIHFENLQSILRLAHQHNCRIYLTLNILILEQEIPALITLLNKLLQTPLDGIIVQDLGLFYLLSHYFNRFSIHASTQLTTHNEGQIEFLSQLGAKRVNLSRELNLNEIRTLTHAASNHGMDTEVFVHGSYCLSFSGLCYLSSVHGGNSGNRGRCSQPCRDRYQTTPAGKEYPLNLKDNSALFDLKELAEAGVASLKIEGRIKRSDYVHTVVQTWRRQLDEFYHNGTVGRDNSNLFKVFNRDFSDGYLRGQLTNDLFIDNPRDHSVDHLAEINNYHSPQEWEADKLSLYREKEELQERVKAQIETLSIAPAPLALHFSGSCNTPLTVKIVTDGCRIELHSERLLSATGTQPLNREVILKRFKALNEAGYILKTLTLEFPAESVFLPFKELTALRDRVRAQLTGAPIKVNAAVVPSPITTTQPKLLPTLMVLTNQPEQVNSLTSDHDQVYFQLPSGFGQAATKLTDLFLKHPTLLPWFPPVLIDNDFRTAVRWLQQRRPSRVITNNTGIAWACHKFEIPWIAGPFLNLTNSYSLLCLKEHWNCVGAFLSNELSKTQIKAIQKPKDFDLYYSLYHPILLMTSRQCLTRQVHGCHKKVMDKDCLTHCAQSSTLTNMKDETFHIVKTKGFHHRLYDEVHFLNTDIVSDLPHLFSGFLADLTDVKTNTKPALEPPAFTHLFRNLLRGERDAAQTLQQEIGLTTNHPYRIGL